MHHIDEENQNHDKHIMGLEELKRVTKKGGKIIIVEGNRFNPLFYPHMVKMCGYNHFKQSYFKKIIREAFPSVKFKFFESHLYSKKYLKAWKVYEKIMESIAPKSILSYNVAIIDK